MTEKLAIQPEYITQERREKQLSYDLQTQFAELVDGIMRTEFDLHFNEYDLIGEDGRGMKEVAQTSIDEAKEVASLYPELRFEVRRRGFEEDEIWEATDMARGEGPNSMVILSDFPAELEDATEDVGGYNVTRKIAMLRVLVRKPDGNIRMYSQSLDGSNREALEAIYLHFGKNPDPGELLPQRVRVDLSDEAQSTLVDKLTGIYDRSLTEQFGEQWYAGRRTADYRNTYNFVSSQQDLIEECVRLDTLGWLNDDVMYRMSATMQKRFETKHYVGQQEVVDTIQSAMTIDPRVLYQEINLAGSEAQKIGKAFSACGITLRSEGTDNSTENQMEQSGYGNKAINENGDCEFISKNCPECKEKDVKTRVHKLPSGKKIISGSCGCAVIR